MVNLLCDLYAFVFDLLRFSCDLLMILAVLFMCSEVTARTNDKALANDHQ